MEDTKTTPDRREHSLWRAIFRWSVRILLLVMGLVLAALLWLGSESGLTQALSWAQQFLARNGQALAFDRLQGNLWRGIRFGRVEWRGFDTAVKGTDLQLRWSLRALLRGKGLVHQLEAGTLVIQVPPGDPDKPRTDVDMPGDFGLPFPLEIRKLAVGRLEIQPPAVNGKDAEPYVVLTDIDGTAEYAVGQYRIKTLALTSPWGQVRSATAQMEGAPPHRLKGVIQANGHAQQWPYDVTLTVDGDLARLPATLQGQLADGMADIQAVVKPLGRMPAERLHARLADTNLMRFTALGKLPETGMDLDLDIDPAPGKKETWQGLIRLANRRAGTLEGNRIPLRSLQSGIVFRIPPTAQWEHLYVALNDLAIGLPVSVQQADAGGVAEVPANAKPGNGAGKGQAPQKPQAAQPVTIAAKGEARIEGRLESWLAQSMAIPGTTLPRLKSDLKLTGLDLAPLWQGLPRTALGGQVKVDGQQFLVDLSQRAEQMRTLLPADLKKLAADAQVKLAGMLDPRWLKLNEGRVALGETLLTASGQAAVSAPWDLNLRGTARRLDLAQWLPATLPVDPAWREGMLGADWSVEGRLMSPGQKATVGLDLVESRVAGQPLTGGLHGKAELDAQWQPLSLKDIDLKLAHGTANRIQAKGALGAPQDQLDVGVKLNDLSTLDRRAAGSMNLDGHLSGRFQDLSAKASARASGVDWTILDEAGKPNRLSLKDLKLDLTAPLALQAKSRQDTPVELALSARQLGSGTDVLDALNLSLHGTPSQHQLAAAARQGKDRLQLRLQGALSLPRTGPSYRASVETLDLSGRTAVRLVDPAPLAVDGSRLTLSDFRLAALDGHIDLKRLLLDWSGPLKYETRGSLDDLAPLRLHQLLGVDEQKNLDALKDVRIAGQWQLRGQGAQALYGDVQAGIREQVPAGRRKRLGLRDNNGLALRFDERKLNGKVNLDIVSLELVNLFTGPDMAVDGSLKVDGTVAGTLDAPLVDLGVTGKDLSVLQRSAGMRLSGGELDAHLSGHGLQIKHLKFHAGQGSLQLKGAARLVDRGNMKAALATQDAAWAAALTKPPKAGSPKPSLLPMDGVFDVRADHFLVPIGPGQRVTLSGVTRLTSGPAGLILVGDMKVDEGLIELAGSSAPTLPGDVRVSGEQIPQDLPEEKDAEASLRIASDLEVELGDKLKINGMGAEARLGGKLQVGGFLPADPQLTGVVNIVDGSYQAYGQNLKFTKGLIRFTGPVDNPSLDIEAKRPYLPVEVGISITGQASNPRISLISKPSMSETNKLSWLVLGVPPDEAGGAAQVLALQQAGTMLLGNDNGVRSPSIAERLGLDVLNYGYASNTGVDSGIQESMTPKGLVGSSSSSNADATETGVVSLGKRINDRLFVSYEKGVRGVWNLLRIQYTLGKGYVLRAQTGSDNSLDVLRSRSFD